MQVLFPAHTAISSYEYYPLTVSKKDNLKVKSSPLLTFNKFSFYCSLEWIKQTLAADTLPFPKYLVAKHYYKTRFRKCQTSGGSQRGRLSRK